MTSGPPTWSRRTSKPGLRDLGFVYVGDFFDTYPDPDRRRDDRRRSARAPTTSASSSPMPRSPSTTAW
ncbi:MAG: hypothetical protein MZU97_13080 [Bacillus subtilis]|nr:hypothetical protein [Bacillus subtilis]